MKNQTPKILKLSNGENIIGFVSEDNDYFNIDYPLSMIIVMRPGKSGPYESLNLTKWVQSLTDERDFRISEKHVIISFDASEGLSDYYNFVLKHMMDDIENPLMTQIEKLASKIEDSVDENLVEEDEDIYDELLKELDTESKLIH